MPKNDGTSANIILFCFAISDTVLVTASFAEFTGHARVGKVVAGGFSVSFPPLKVSYQFWRISYFRTFFFGLLHIVSHTTFVPLAGFLD